MLTWVVRRLLAVVPVLFGVTLAVFSTLFLVPGDPVKMMLAEFVTNPDQVARTTLTGAATATSKRR